MTYIWDAPKMSVHYSIRVHMGACGFNIKLISVRITSEPGALSSRKKLRFCTMFNMANYYALFQTNT